MQVVSEDDINMYARGLLGRQGPSALRYAKGQSKRLAAMRDKEGAVVWERVADAVAGGLKNTSPSR